MKLTHAYSKFLREYASEFYIASTQLSTIRPFQRQPTFYLALHSLELGLKAHLSLVGVSKQRLASRVLGHNLCGLLKEAQDKCVLGSLGLTAADCRNVCLGSRHYGMKCLEYPEVFHSTFPIGVWLRWSKKVLDALPL